MEKANAEAMRSKMENVATICERRTIEVPGFDPEKLTNYFCAEPAAVSVTFHATVRFPEIGMVGNGIVEIRRDGSFATRLVH